MHRALTARWLSRALRISEVSPSTGVPLYLCPAIGLSSISRTANLAGASISRRRATHTEVVLHDAPTTTIPEPMESEEPRKPEEPPTAPARRLPLMCSGCGAFSQTDDPQQLGYFDVKSKRTRTWLHPKKTELKSSEAEEDQLVADALKALGESKLKELGLSPSAMIQGEESEKSAMSSHSLAKPPVCDRCHNLIHYSITSDTAKVAMYHPTVESLRETIEESPHKYNHIYHIIDAADFPMSLIPRLNDRQTEMSFIITRSDLLGPTKEMVDAMMPYLREVLRDALGRVGERVRLGNVSCVSAKRSWWTKEVREDIWKRGGAGWMVGKVNVGKSQLFEAVYPKGRMTESKNAERANVQIYPRASLAGEAATEDGPLQDDLGELDFGELLPPPQPARNYPEMPLVSSLPGTTASPIRIPFGNGKGELIDLPGLARSDLELFVKEEHRQSLIMKKRIIPEQISVKPDKSLILGGGLIRITPRTPNMVFLMYNFTPLEEHLTMTEKAIGFQNQTRESVGLENITLPGVGDKMGHAGTFKLRHDVTKKRAGPLTRKNAVGLQVDRLPFRVLSVDILIEGVGYVEVVAQVRARDVEPPPKTQRIPRSFEPSKREPTASQDPFLQKFGLRRDTVNESIAEEVEVEAEPNWPAVDVYTPEGRFVDSRQPINGWLNNKPRVLPEHKKSRPRRSMKGQKKMGKQLRRGSEA
ncbi:Found in mitochondrial proteome 38-like protein [Cladobotryum mycophilum]|uniref:Found in mitochondrial proteome 38-like protein n=1 Tax=Cladobotryum mycophilum TaxID=491253 RepID=A0ABR0SYH4_9HYPO